MRNHRFLLFSAATVMAACLVAGLASSCVAQGAVAWPPSPLDNYALQLNGSFADFLQDARGGAISANVLEVREPDSCTSTKHISQVKYEDFDVLAFIPPGGPLFDWVTASFTCEPTRADGVLADLGFAGGIMWSKQFFNALISEVTIPACDARSADPGFLEIKFSPELIRRMPPGPGHFAFRQKLWLTSNFRLSIPGLDTASVVRIEPMVIKRQIIEFRDATTDTVRKLPGTLTIPNVVVTLPLSKAASWTAWHEDFVVNGNNAPAREKEGVLTLLAPDFRTVVARIMLHHLGIIQVEPSPSGQGALSSVSMVTAVMYCDSMEFLPR